MTDSIKSWFLKQKVIASVAGDGFDDRILRTKAEWRTANIFNAGETIPAEADNCIYRTIPYLFHFPSSSAFEITAGVASNKPHPVLFYSFKPSQTRLLYSVGYTGAPSFSGEKVAGIWQPLIWQEKRIPDAAYLHRHFLLPYLLHWCMMNQYYWCTGIPGVHLFQPLPAFHPTAGLHSTAECTSAVAATGICNLFPVVICSKWPQEKHLILNGYCRALAINSYLSASRSKGIYGLKITGTTILFRPTQHRVMRVTPSSHYAWFIDSLGKVAHIPLMCWVL